MKFIKNSNARKKVWTAIGFGLGLIGFLIALASFLSLINKGLFSIVLPILLGLIGFVIILRTKKKLNDDIVKAGLVINPVSIVLGVLRLIL